ncbi:MAG: rod shape-determining protein [Candidatus Omnitrophica bacterium]|nr:rod shape-determining protein [Candidatus Omnitrophota bacterium]
MILVDRILGFFSGDVGIDLGTANTLVYVKGQGVVLCEPSVVAIDRATHQVLAVGEEANDITEAMLRYFIRKVHRKSRLVSPRVVIAVPSGITEVEKRAVKDSAERAGARSPVYLVEEPIAAAVGVGLPIHEPSGNMIIDIGGGTTEIAVISLSGIVFSKSIRIAGDELDEAVIGHLKKTYNLMIGERTAEEIKIKIGSAYPMEEETNMEVRGRDILAGLPKTITVTSEEIREALSEPLAAILEAIRIALERTPPELCSDLIERGLILAGGGALLRGLDKLISEETGLPVHIADDPLTAIALGTGRYLSDFRLLKRLAVNSQNSKEY